MCIDKAIDISLVYYFLGTQCIVWIKGKENIRHYAYAPMEHDCAIYNNSQEKHNNNRQRHM